MKKIFIIGLGPGNPDGMTLAARTALKQAQLICGYGIYVEQAAAVCPDTPVPPGAGKSLLRGNGGDGMQRGCRRVRHGRAFAGAGAGVSAGGDRGRWRRNGGNQRRGSVGSAAGP